jgi:hypothetical protein
LHRRLGGPQSRSGRGGEEKRILANNTLKKSDLNVIYFSIRSLHVFTTSKNAAEVRNILSYTFTPPCVFMTSYLVKYRDEFTHKNAWNFTSTLPIDTRSIT